MCTVTLIARRNGYALGMNRDEQLSRVKGLPPAQRIEGGRKIVCPSEPGGGTWIALNDAGVTFALINWYAINARVRSHPVSRGVVVNAVSRADSTPKISCALNRLPITRINPFRLIAVIPSTKEIVEWRWDLKTLSRLSCVWESQQWISSGYDEPQAQRIRSTMFQRAAELKNFGTLDWLRALHRTHEPERGPFSTCMHRVDAATVSYTEVSVSASSAIMRHSPKPLCETVKPQTMSKLSIVARRA